ncbi:MAG: hypothetical protein FWD60_01310 [Candidatus Azobacteroides sp.]|nr:hypothetical protein [Candidatus Azobacteroides sp.]
MLEELKMSSDFVREEQDKYERAVAIWKKHLKTLEYLKFPVSCRLLSKLPDKILKIFPIKIQTKLSPRDKIYYFDTNNKYRRQIYKDSCLVVGETLFTNSLCHSKYLNIKVEATDDEDIKLKKDKTRKLLLNIDNLKQALNFIKQEHQDALSSQWNNKSIILAIAGIIVSGLGLFVTIKKGIIPLLNYLKDWILINLT